MSKLCAALVALAACGGKAAETSSSSETDALWAMAPDGAKLGVVVSSRAMAMTEHAWLDVYAWFRGATELTAAKQRLEDALVQLTGAPSFHFADVGIATDKGGALFVAGERQNLVIVPVADRDKLLARIHGTRGEDRDTLENGVCKTIKNVYACANDAAMFDRIGKGDLAKRLGARGDIEIVGDLQPLGMPATVAASVQLSRGQVVVRASLSAAPPDLLAMLAASAMPRVGAGDAGFALAHIGPLLARASDEPFAGGVSLAQLGRSLGGPVTLTAPGGALGLDVRVPLADPAPATALVAHCDELAARLGIPAVLDGAACNLTIPSMGLQLTAWVAGSELRLGKHGPAAPAAIPSTAIGAELAKTAWAAAFWGHGTMFGPGLPAAAPGELAPESAFALRAMSFVNEVGAAVKLEGGAVKVTFGVRTVWANPDDVVAKVLAIQPQDIAAGKASALAQPIVAAAPDSPFAKDVAAGYSGLIVPAALIGMMSAVAVPAAMDYLRRGGEH